MHKLSTRVAVLEHELSELRVLLEREAGVLFDGPTEMLTARVAGFLESRHLTSASDLIKLIQSSETENEALLESLLDGETGFFRNLAAFEAFEKKVLPELHDRKSADSPCCFRIWSAGCSTGEEAYSIAVSVCQGMSGAGGWNIHIVASDIRRQALAIARRGLYSEQAIVHVPPNLIKAYFSKIGQHFLVKPRLRNLVTFTPMNLVRPVYIGRFDCIFCMDVLRHFSMAQRIALVQRLHLYLQPGGYLLLGLGDKLPAVDPGFQIHTDGGFTVYQKPLSIAAKSGR